MTVITAPSASRAVDDLYWRLEAVSKVLESTGRIDEHEQPGAYATILDAMIFLHAAADQCRCGDRAASACPGEWEPGCSLGADEKYVRGAERELAAESPGDRARAHADRICDAAMLRELAAEPQSEPVAWYLPQDGYDSMFRDHSTVVACTGNKWEGWIPLYAHPPRTAPLTDEQIKSLPAWWPSYDGHSAIIELVRSVERAHGIGETK